MTDTQAVGRRVDAAASAVDGVTRVYSAAPAVVGLIRSVAPSDDALSIVRGRDPLEAVVSIGVDVDASSADVAQRVADAVRAELGGTALVHVRVSRVHLAS
ncbi:MAG: hypothetical protein ABWY36_08615 [Leifsonia sp.]